MAGIFVCPDCGSRIHCPEWDGGDLPKCQHDNRLPTPDLYETEMMVVD